MSGTGQSEMGNSGVLGLLQMAEKMVEDAKSEVELMRSEAQAEASKIVDEARSQSDELLAKAEKTLEEAQEKADLISERNEALMAEGDEAREAVIVKAQSEAAGIVSAAHSEASKIKDGAMSEMREIARDIEKLRTFDRGFRESLSSWVSLAQGLINDEAGSEATDSLPSLSPSVDSSINPLTSPVLGESGVSVVDVIDDDNTSAYSGFFSRETRSYDEMTRNMGDMIEQDSSGNEHVSLDTEDHSGSEEESATGENRLVNEGGSLNPDSSDGLSPIDNDSSTDTTSSADSKQETK